MRLSFVLRNIFFALTLALGSVMTFAQSADLGPPLTLSNPSFEDMPRQNHPPKGWFDCGYSNESPVDVHPGNMLAGGTPFFGVDTKAFDGNTYLGMVVRDNETYEAVSQRILDGPLKAGQCYTFSIYLARAKRYNSISRATDQPVNYDTPVKLRIWGGFSYCNKGEVLAESAPVKSTEWLQYNFRFEPKRDHAYLVLEAYYKTPVLFPYNGNLLLDAAGKINPIPCDNDTPPEPEIADVPEADPPAKKPVKPAVVDVPTKPAPETPTTPAKPVNQNATLAGKRISELKPGSIIRVDKLFFKADSTALSASSMETIEEITDFLTIHSNVSIEIGGHTNNIPSDAFCDQLSLARATSVVDQLVQRGIDRSRLDPVGYGKRKPVATNRTPTGRKRNQRVEIKVLSLGS